MGTNFYLHIIPSKERKKELQDAIKADDFPLIKRLTEELYGDLRKDWDSDELTGGMVHLGKRSCGWKFLWNPNVYVVRNGHLEDVDGCRRYIEDPDTALYLYPLTKKGIKAFIDRKDVGIYDEYDTQQDKEEFWKMALEWGYGKKDKGWDAASYEKEYPSHSYRIYSELTRLLEKEGYKFTSWTCSDFYSDGLRFASYTEFG